MIVGQTGSGKSTLVQQINGLLRPTKGQVQVGKIKITPKMNGASLLNLRKNVGLVFQIPQDQLFGETVLDDLAFGPRNFNFSNKQIHTSVLRSAHDLNLSKNILMKSPFDLSGGQMKRVAIADVLACHPKILVLDEPTVGLDSFGVQKMMTLLEQLRKDYHLTIVMITHQMSLVAKYATQVLVLHRGHLLADMTPSRLFENMNLLCKAGLRLPFPPRFAKELSCLGIDLSEIPLTKDQLADLIVSKLRTGPYHE